MSQRRIYQNKYPYLITTNVKGGDWLLSHSKIALIVVGNIFKFNKIYPSDLFGYCIMPNHIHLLIQFQEKNDISNYMHDIKSLSSTEIRENFGWNVAIWKKRFYDQIINNKRRFVISKNYIIKNPGNWDLYGKFVSFPYIYLNNELINRRINDY